MKKSICFFGVLSLLLTACEKDDTQLPEPPVRVYRVISVEYGDIRVVPSPVTEETTYLNSGNIPLPTTYASESEKGYTSQFMPVGLPEGEIAACEIPVPEVDREGVPRITRFRTAPVRTL